MSLPGTVSSHRREAASRELGWRSPELKAETKPQEQGDGVSYRVRSAGGQKAGPRVRGNGREKLQAVERKRQALRQACHAIQDIQEYRRVTRARGSHHGVLAVTA